MSTEVVKEAKLEEEPRQCTKKEKLGHAIGVLGHDSMYTLWSTWTTPFFNGYSKAARRLPSVPFWWGSIL